MTQDAVQFSGDVWIGSGRANPDCLTGRRVTPLCGTPFPSPSNNAGKKVSLSAFYARMKIFPMPGVTQCMNAHSCWSDFCSPAYAVCVCLWETPERFSTDSAHPMILSPNHLSYASLSPLNPPR